MIEIKNNSFKARQISEHVYWVGAIDWSLRDFHGYETSRGSTYNAFLILTEEPILIDTVKAPFFDEMLERIKSVIDPQKIKYIVSNHAEMDHSGCLPQAIEVIKPEKIFASKIAINTLKEHFHNLDINLITPITNNEFFTLGNATLKCIETKMLHWPESMFTYFAEDKILFSQDAFGMHLASSCLFADEVHDQSVIHYEASKYFANILLPYAPLVNKLINNFSQFNLECSIIAPDHGPLWRNTSIQQIIDLWQNWSQQRFYNKVVIGYETMWGSTAKMARAIADGILSCNTNCQVKVLPLSQTHRSDLITELLDSGGFILGSPTINQNIFPVIADHLCYLKGLKAKNLLGQVFGSYGWGGEAINLLQHNLQEMNISLIGEAIKCKHVPTAEVLQQCEQFGKNFAIQLQEKVSATN